MHLKQLTRTSFSLTFFSATVPTKWKMLVSGSKVNMTIIACTQTLRSIIIVKDLLSSQIDGSNLFIFVMAVVHDIEEQ